MELSLEKILRPRRIGSLQVYEALKKEEVHIYLAGPINFVEDLQAYREELTRDLLKISPKFKIHDPWLREQAMNNKFSHASSEEDKVLAEQIITADLEDIVHCDLLLAYFFRVGAGTPMEIFFASRILGKPVVLIYLLEGKIPLWLYGHSNLIFRSKRGFLTWLKQALKEIEGEKQNL